MNLEQLKDQIWDYMSGRYRTPARAVAAELRQPLRRVRKALDRLVAEGRIFEICDEGQEVLYRCIFAQPAWLDAVMEAAACEGWPGLSYSYIGEDHQLMVYPAPFIRAGHESKGILWMSDWYIEVSDVLALFDEEPNVTFGEIDGDVELSIEGTLAGEDVWLTFMHCPPKNALPLLLLDEQGDFRELDDEEIAEFEETYPNRDEDDEEDEERGPTIPLPQIWKPSDN
jgi:hypothetical protein